MNRSYPNAALRAVCDSLLVEWQLTQEEITNLAKDLPGECEFVARTHKRSQEEAS